MPRKFPKPFFRTGRGWFVQLGKQQIKLADGPENADTEAAALRRYHEVMAAREQEEVEAPASTGLTVAEVCDKFLSWCQTHREPLTYKGYLEFIQGFITFLKDKALLPASELRPFHVSEWVDVHLLWGPTRRRNAMIHVTRPFNWAYKLGYIDANPIRHLDKPQAKRRDNPITPEDFATLIAAVKDQAFRDLLTFAWQSGCRPQEVRHIEVRHINFPAARIEIPPAEAKGRKRWRIIRLTEKTVELVRRRLGTRTEGKLFLNLRGKPWKAQAIVCRFQRLKKKLGKGFAMYDARHGFATRKLVAGVDHLTVAELLGHVDGRTLSTTYQHLNREEAHLQEALRKASE